MIPIYLNCFIAASQTRLTVSDVSSEPAAVPIATCRHFSITDAPVFCHSTAASVENKQSRYYQAYLKLSTTHRPPLPAFLKLGGILPQ